VVFNFLVRGFIISVLLFARLELVLLALTVLDISFEIAMNYWLARL